jgi:hypothetical protein
MIGRQVQAKTVTVKLLYAAGLLSVALILIDLRQNLAYAVAALWLGANIISFITARRRTESPRLHIMQLFKRAAIIGCTLLFVLIGVYYLSDNIQQSLRYTRTYEKLYGNYYQDPTTNTLRAMGPVGYTIGAARFILGPGPFRSTQQFLFDDVFIASSKTGDLLILLGAIQWWMTLIIAVYYVLHCHRARLILVRGADWAFLTALQISSYTYVYMGTGDTRHRAVMYIFAAPLLVWLFCWRDLRRRRYVEMLRIEHVLHGPGVRQQ